MHHASNLPVCIVSASTHYQFIGCRCSTTLREVATRNVRRIHHIAKQDVAHRGRRASTRPTSTRLADRLTRRDGLASNRPRVTLVPRDATPLKVPSSSRTPMSTQSTTSPRTSSKTSSGHTRKPASKSTSKPTTKPTSQPKKTKHNFSPPRPLPSFTTTADSPVLTTIPTTHDPSTLLPLPTTPSQLLYACAYFTAIRPRKLLSTATFRTLPQGLIPEVTFLGRSNVGKSSLLNALFGVNPLSAHTSSLPAPVSKNPGRTKSMNALTAGDIYHLPQKKHPQGRNEWFSREGVVLMDMPGYGKGSHEEWGTEIGKYLTQRKQLCRTFLLVDGKVGLQKGDVEMLRMLVREGVGFWVVVSKLDKRVEFDEEGKEKVKGEVRRVLEGVRDQIAGVVEQQRGGLVVVPPLLGVALTEKMQLGLDEVRWSILESTRKWNVDHGRKVLEPKEATRASDSRNEASL